MRTHKTFLRELAQVAGFTLFGLGVGIALTFGVMVAGWATAEAEQQRIIDDRNAYIEEREAAGETCWTFVDSPAIVCSGNEDFIARMEDR